MRRVLLLGSMLFAIGGCTAHQQYWAAPGATETTFEAASSTCDKAALVHFPPMTMGVPGYFATPEEFCSPTAAGTNCMIINPGYLPQVQSSADTNASPRSNAFRSCMVTKGWRPVYQAAGGGFIQPSGVTETTVAQALSYCEAKFKGQRDTAAESGKFHDCVVTRAREPAGPPPPG